MEEKNLCIVRNLQHIRINNFWVQQGQLLPYVGCQNQTIVMILSLCLVTMVDGFPKNLYGGFSTRHKFSYGC